MSHLSYRKRKKGEIVTSPIDIDTNSSQLIQCIKSTSAATFKPRKPFSLKAARWWNDDCQAAVANLHNAATEEDHAEANKTLKSTISKAKRNWANNLLNGATTATLW